MTIQEQGSIVVTAGASS